MSTLGLWLRFSSSPLLLKKVTDCSEEALKESCSYGLGLLPIITAMVFVIISITIISSNKVYIFMFNIGYGSLVWMTATEILPAKIRSSTNGLTVRANADLVI